MSNILLSKPFIIGAAATVVLSGVGTYVWKQEHRPHILEIYVFAVKGGQSIFIRTPEDRHILINGGSNSEIISRLTHILPFYSRRIDAVIATNAEGKNVSGLIDVLKRYRVDRAYISRVTLKNIGIARSTDKIYETFIETMNDMKVDIQEVKAGDHVDFSESVTGDMLFPVSISDFQYSKASAPEIVMNIVYGSTSVILAGDISTKVQKHLVSSKTLSHSDVLVVSGNGSASSVASQCIDVVRPQYFVYSKTISKSNSLHSSKKVVASGRSVTSSKTKKIEDPLATILNEYRFNVQEQITVKIISDGKTISVQ